MRKKSGAILDLSRNEPAGAVDHDTIGLTSSLPPKDVINLHVNCGLSHIVQRDGLAFETEIQLAQDMIAKPKAFIERPLDMIFGLETHGNFTDFSVLGSADENKKHTLHQLQAYIHGLTGARSIRDEAMLVADELYTNGAKNAAPLVGPVDPEEIRPGWVRFVARSDGRRLVLGCIDSYGLLEITMITKRIQKCFENGVAGSIKYGAGGAGIGSFMVFNACTSLYIAVEKGQRTIVLCALPLNKRLKETINLPKNLHTLVVGGASLTPVTGESDG